MGAPFSLNADLTLFFAVSLARRLHAEGWQLPQAAAWAAQKYGLHAAEVFTLVKRALEACAEARRLRDSALIEQKNTQASRPRGRPRKHDATRSPGEARRALDAIFLEVAARDAEGP